MIDQAVEGEYLVALAPTNLVNGDVVRVGDQVIYVRPAIDDLFVGKVGDFEFHFSKKDFDIA
jgi:hypothetical protein